MRRDSMAGSVVAAVVLCCLVASGLTAVARACANDPKPGAQEVTGRG